MSVQSPRLRMCQPRLLLLYDHSSDGIVASFARCYSRLRCMAIMSHRSSGGTNDNVTCLNIMFGNYLERSFI
jgi:hypothetical protein